MSCWTELTEAQQDELILSLEQALTSQEIPEITQTLLNLAEFMEHCDKVSTVEIFSSNIDKFDCYLLLLLFCITMVMNYFEKIMIDKIDYFNIE